VSSACITIARASARYALSGVRGIPRAKGTSARADGLVIEFERADAVEDIMTEARGPRIGLMARHECAMPRAGGSASTRAESVFVDEELFTVLTVRMSESCLAEPVAEGDSPSAEGAEGHEVKGHCCLLQQCHICFAHCSLLCPLAWGRGRPLAG